MTGAGFRVMKFIKVMLTAAVLAVTIVPSVKAASKADATVNIQVAFTAPTCNIKVPSPYNLGVMTIGESETPHIPIDIEWDCGKPVGVSGQSFITASVKKGAPDSLKEWVQLFAKNSETGSGVFLSLKSGNSYIKMDDSTKICQQNSSQGSCKLIPITKVSAGSVKTGEVEGILIFKAHYS